ncbi:MAG TPA: AAA family ATPase [Flavitalea sp.]|nr:AAA family ATPase [Flavitalea sp.]
MKILIKQLSITNFKGIKSLEVDFESAQTNIYGDNATGKTTVFDAFTWLMFGKDSSDRKDFDIKPLDRNGRKIDRTENEVAAILEVDGKTIPLKRVQREKWVKKKGALEAEFTGNEQLFYWNDVPLQAGEYQAKINLLLQENVFKLITNTLYFNSMKWQDRRAVLMEMAGDISNAELAASDSRFNSLVETLSNKSLSEFKKEIAAKKKKIKDDLETIPARIDELNRSMPAALDYIGIKSQIAFNEAEIKAIDEQIADRSKAYEAEYQKVQEHQKKVHELQLRKDRLYYEIKGQYDRLQVDAGRELREKSAELKTVERQIADKQAELKRAESRLELLQKQMAEKRQEWEKVNADQLTFNEHEFSCPTCKRAYDTQDIDIKKTELLENFNHEKTRKLVTITEVGKSYAQDAEAVKKTIKELTLDIERLDDQKLILTAQLQDLQNQQTQPAQSFEDFLAARADYAAIVQEVESVQAAVPEVQKPDLDKDKQDKARFAAALDDLKRQLATKEQRERAQVRIAELETSEKSLAQQLADLEGQEFLIAEFSKAKIDAMEARINGKFKLVTFKMFNTLINGGVEEACEAMVNGVPFSGLNTAMRINAGLDIINALCEYYQVNAPIFIDNRESITELIDCDSQIINLIVTPGQAELRVA